MSEEQRRKKMSNIWSIAILIGMLLLAVLLVWKVFGASIPELFQLIGNGDEEAIEAYLAEQNRMSANLTIILLSILQVVSIVLPGFAIQIAAGVIYPWYKAFFLCYLGFVLGNMIVFRFARRMGDNISSLVLNEKNEKKSTWLAEKMATERPGMIVAIANLLPIMPNGIIPYIAATSTIKSSSFLIAIMITSWVQIFFNCIAGSFLLHGQYLFMVLALSFQVVLMICITIKRKELLRIASRVMWWVAGLRKKKSKDE